MVEHPPFVVKVATGSSLDLLRERLNNYRTLEWAVSDNFTVFLHQGPSHINLMHDQGLNEYDVMFLGNTSVFEREQRLIVRAKSQRNLPPFLREDRQFHEAERVIMQLLDELEFEIAEFSVKLWQRDNPLQTDYFIRRSLYDY